MNANKTTNNERTNEVRQHGEQPTTNNNDNSAATTSTLS